MVELATVRQEGTLQVEDGLERGLHAFDVLANRDAPADVIADVRRARQVVGVGMGLENPINLQTLGLDICQHLVRRGCAGVAGLEVVVKHRVDDGRVVASVV